MSNPYVRQIQIDQIAERMTDETQKEIIRNYRASLKAIKQQMADLYERYEKNGILTYAEMARYNRIDGMFKGINKELYTLTGTNMRQTKRLASDVFQESYYRTAFVFEEAMQANLSFSLIDPKVIQASVENPISGLTLNETLQKNRVNIIRDIKQTVTQGLIQGSSYKKMADRLTTTFEGDAVKANRVVRTEAHRNKEAGSLAAAKHAKDLGVEFEVIWIAILDDRTRDQHGAMDGQIATNKTDGTWEFVFPDGLKTPAPGMSGYAHQDINCRCSTAKYPFGFLPKARRVEGEIREYQTYDEWVEEKGITKKATHSSDNKPVSTESLKEQQFNIIQKTNPMRDDIHTGIRNAADIRSPEEAFKTMVDPDEHLVYPDFTQEDALKALSNGEITVYSSKPIDQGAFVSPSKMMAQDYAGGPNAKIYSAKVKIDDVAWINADEGQLAKITANMPTSFRPETARDAITAKGEAKRLLSISAELEPNITDKMKMLAVENNVVLEGLDHRLKSTNSLTRKIRSDYREALGNVSFTDVADSIGDSVRYTVIANEKVYTQALDDVYRKLSDAGYKPYKFKNYWDPNMTGSAYYHGVNSNWISSTGQKIELQFHTAESFSVKDKISHKIYEKKRVSTDPVFRAQCDEELKTIWGTVPIPNGISTYKIPQMTQ